MNGKSSGQWFWENIFHTYHTSAFVKLFSCVSKYVTHLGSCFGKQFPTKLTIFPLKMASPHCGYICASSGQWFWKNIFHIYHTYAFVKLFSCVRKHMTHLGSWFGKQFLTKVTIFLFKMASPHCGYICASSGQWFGNIFFTSIALLRLFMQDTFAHKTHNFPSKNGFDPLWLNLCVREASPYQNV